MLCATTGHKYSKADQWGVSIIPLLLGFASGHHIWHLTTLPLLSMNYPPPQIQICRAGEGHHQLYLRQRYAHQPCRGKAKGGNSGVTGVAGKERHRNCTTRGIQTKRNTSKLCIVCTNRGFVLGVDVFLDLRVQQGTMPLRKNHVNTHNLKHPGKKKNYLIAGSPGFRGVDSDQV